MMHTNVDVHAFFRNTKNGEWSARFGGLQERYKKYGFEDKTLQFPDDSLNVRFQTWRGRLGYRNIARTDLGISYAPELRFEIFSDLLSNSESHSYLNLPLQKTIGTSFQADLAIEASLARYKPEGKSDISNNFFSIAPSLQYKANNAHIQAGLKPTWDNGTFRVLPNVLAEVRSSDARFSFQAGWIGSMRYRGYQYMATMNPWIFAPDSTYNARIEERYAGFKGSAGDHFTYSAKIAYNKLHNQPLYIQDGETGKSFITLNEREMSVLNFGGELGFNVGEQFSIISNLTFNQYKPKESEKAWGLLPLEFNTTMRLQVIKDLYANANLFAFDGPWSLTKDGRKKLQGAMDLSAGLEFKITEPIKIWAQFNNIFNKEYQRWNQYPVYGFNFLAGVVISFAQKN